MGCAFVAVIEGVVKRGAWGALLPRGFFQPFLFGAGFLGSSHFDLSFAWWQPFSWKQPL